MRPTRDVALLEVGHQRAVGRAVKRQRNGASLYLDRMIEPGARVYNMLTKTGAIALLLSTLRRWCSRSLRHCRSGEQTQKSGPFLQRPAHVCRAAILR